VGNLRDERTRALKKEHPSLRELCERNLEGGLLYWGRRRICKGRLWKRQSPSIGHRWATMDGTLLYRGLCEKGEILSHQDTLFNEESERYVKEGSGNRELSQ